MVLMQNSNHREKLWSLEKTLMFETMDLLNVPVFIGSVPTTDPVCVKSM